MNKLPIAGLVVLMLLVVSGYVASEPTEIADEARYEASVVSVDPHVNYYAQFVTGLSQDVR